jgi:hypothetical protein
LTRAGLKPWTFYLCLTNNWDHRLQSLYPISLLRWDLINFFAQAGLEPQSSWSLPPE